MIDYQGADWIELQDEDDLVIIKRGDTVEPLRTDVTYECRFVRNGESYQEINLKILQSANIPAVFIETESGTLEAVNADKDYKEPGSFALISEEGQPECIDDLDYITGRGNDTWLRPKKSYGIKLQSPANLLCMGEAKHWVLLCNVIDDIYLRNKITYDMAVTAGMDGAPKSQFVDLYINHSYHGMYQLSEKVEIDRERIPIRSLEADNEKVNKDYKAAGKFGDDRSKGVILEETPEDISGGYLVERDLYSKYTVETSGFQSTVSQEYYTIKSPEYASETEVAYVRNLFGEMEAAIRDKNGTNPVTQKSYLEYIDLLSFAQKYIIEEMSANNGGGASSSFFYKPEDAVSHKIFAGPVWDYDKAYGILRGYNANTRALGYLTLRDEGTTLFRELYKHAEFRDAVSMCWKRFFSEYMESIYKEKIDYYYAEIENAVKMDRARWSKYYGIYNWKEENEKRINYLKRFIEERKRFLDEVWGENAEICTVTFEEPKLQIHTTLGVIRGEKIVPVSDDDIRAASGIYLEGWRDAKTGELFDESLPVERDMVLTGIVREQREAE